ncbi:PREDICTED: 2-aminoethanethiol dioxygenase [Ceratosolen solmsi marchali]|uniref:2-aminoethanethiol dioxygenase n=1 Tax=Ceratosolen solmsi marchali TaxID=326594 RepID=A0AAJ6YVR7_9HYME|nr:PREDICTED: 2-aminoethanethiol dioxygenase [Ceratosolen solmsi marchali]
MASRIEVLWKLALKTFSGSKTSNYKICLKNFEKLKCLINEINAEDVYVDKKVLDYVNNQSAPMCAIDVFENQDITIAIFILKTGVTLPLHDHPEMHGLLKVISGVVKIDSYSIESYRDKVSDKNKGIAAVKHSSTIIKHTDPACVLTPFLKNLHEITCLEGPAAFLDVLSPPYDTGDYGKGKRPCTFFKVVTINEISDNVQLVATDIPSTFYSKSLNYMGQPLR